jgi:RRXRR protein
LAAFVLDKRKKPLMPCCEKRAWLVLTRRRAVVQPRHPLTIHLKDRVGGDVRPGRVKIGDMVRDAVATGSKATIGRIAAGGGSLRAGNAGAINAAYCKLPDRADGSGYAGRRAPPPAEAGGVERGRRR